MINFERVRPEVKAFAVLMERQLRANDWKGGWDQEHPRSMLRRLREETDELDAEVPVRFTPVAIAHRMRIGKEAADIGNFAMMVADLCRSLPEIQDNAPDELIEKWAIRMALGNNGGAWTTHYTEEQKDHWRRLARELLRDARKEIADA